MSKKLLSIYDKYINNNNNNINYIENNKNTQIRKPIEGNKKTKSIINPNSKNLSFFYSKEEIFDKISPSMNDINMK